VVEQTYEVEVMPAPPSVRSSDLVWHQTIFLLCVCEKCQENTVVGQISFDDIWGKRKCVDPTFMSSEQLSVSVNGQSVLLQSTVKFKNSVEYF
jgi:hypothetical protein